MATSNSPAGQLITENIDIWTSAIKKRGSQGRGSSKKIELYGIKKLRELILELAVRGLLVPQDPSDEPASVLLEKIAAEKEQLIKDGKIKKQKALPVLALEDQLFSTPQGWIYARFADLAFSYKVGLDRGKSQQGLEKEFRYFKMNNILNEGGMQLEDITRVDATINEVNEYELCNGDFLFNTRNSKELVGKTCVFFSKNESSVLYNNNILRAKFANPTLSQFLDIWMRSPSGNALLDLIKSGTTNVWAIYQGKLEKLLCIIPPETEQTRIVAKVDELMALCDQLEQQTETSLLAHQTLVETLLNTLLNADQNSFDPAWERIAQHFDVLFTTEHSIDQLKQTILQLAVMGKLVPQDPNDEPASVLLEKTFEVRDAWLVSNLEDNPECKTMIKKLRKLDEAKEPFPLPESWSCAHLIQVSNLLVDCHNKTAPYVDEGIPIIRTTNIREREFQFAGMKYVNEETYNYWSKRCPPEPGDIMFTREAPMGEGAIIPEGVKWCLGQRTMLIRPMHDFISKEYLLLALTEPHLLERASEHAVGLTVKHLRVGDVERLNIPIPPLKEQYLIAEKVHKLMSICSELKINIQKSNNTQLHLADAMAEQALN